MNITNTQALYSITDQVSIKISICTSSSGLQVRKSKFFFNLKSIILSYHNSHTFTDYLRFQVDNFDPWYQYGPFQGNYTGSNSVLAPFDQEFYFILNLAVGGTNGYFPEEGISYPNGKPYLNAEGRRVGQTKFWQSDMWKYYEENPEDASMQIDYIKVWAV